MKHYTVIGVFASGQRYVEWVYAESPEAAVAIAYWRTEMDLEVAAVIEGTHADVLGGSYAVSPEDLP
jgi:hypothetical protein